MPRTLTASDRKSLIRLASTLPAGSEERCAILAGLDKVAFGTVQGAVGYAQKADRYIKDGDVPMAVNKLAFSIMELAAIFKKSGTGNKRVDALFRDIRDLAADLNVANGAPLAKAATKRTDRR